MEQSQPRAIIVQNQRKYDPRTSVFPEQSNSNFIYLFICRDLYKKRFVHLSTTPYARVAGVRSASIANGECL